jgi:hypothetical protein
MNTDENPDMELEIFQQLMLDSVQHSEIISC